MTENEQIQEIQNLYNNGHKNEADRKFQLFLEERKKIIDSCISPFTSLTYADRDVIFNIAATEVFKKVLTFEADKNVAFWAYARTAVRYEAMRAIDVEYNQIQIPYYQRVIVDKLRKAARTIGMDLSETPPEVICEKLDIEAEKLNAILPYINRAYLYTAEINSAEAEAQINVTASDQKKEAFNITDFFHILTKKEESILRMRHGFHPYQYEHKLKEISAEHNMGVPQISVLIKKCHKKLKKEIERASYAT